MSFFVRWPQEKKLWTGVIMNHNEIRSTDIGSQRCSMDGMCLRDRVVCSLADLISIRRISNLLFDNVARIISKKLFRNQVSV